MKYIDPVVSHVVNNSPGRLVLPLGPHGAPVSLEPNEIFASKNGDIASGLSNVQQEVLMERVRSGQISVAIQVFNTKTGGYQTVGHYKAITPAEKEAIVNRYLESIRGANLLDNVIAATSDETQIVEALKKRVSDLEIKNADLRTANAHLSSGLKMANEQFNELRQRAAKELAMKDAAQEPAEAPVATEEIPADAEPTEATIEPTEPPEAPAAMEEAIQEAETAEDAPKAKKRTAKAASKSDATKAKTTRKKSE